MQPSSATAIGFVRIGKRNEGICILSGSTFLGFLVFLVSSTSLAFGACIDLSKGNSFTLTRNDPLFEVTNKLMNDGTVKEERVMHKDGSTQKVSTTYWNGVIPIDRKSSSSRIQLKMSKKAKTLNLEVAAKTYTIPVSILVNGSEVDRGSYEIETVRQTTLKIGNCRYPVMVVRKSIKRNNGAAINEEALLSLEAGMLLGNVAMTPDWETRHGVFFDQIKAN